jgi:hypothetical protein
LTNLTENSSRPQLILMGQSLWTITFRPEGDDSFNGFKRNFTRYVKPVKLLI